MPMGMDDHTRYESDPEPGKPGVSSMVRAVCIVCVSLAVGFCAAQGIAFVIRILFR